MNQSVIPLEVWLGSFKEKLGAEFEYNFDAEDCVSVKVVDVNLNPFELKQSDPLRYIHGTELTLGINAVLNTDVTMMPEGIKEDFSNVIYFKDIDGKYKYMVFIDGDDVEGGLNVKIKDKDGEIVEVKYFAFTLVPKFDSFLNNETDTFMSIITTGETALNLSEDKAIVVKVKEDAPVFKCTKINLEKTPNLYQYDTVSEMANLTKVGICRYINKCFPNIIHDDMVEKIKHVKLIDMPEGGNKIAISIDLFGFLYFISVDYWPDYDFSVNDEEDEDLEEE